VWRKPREGFTLVELLVVIGIIGVLAGILFPAFGEVRKKAWQTHCASNMRQIHMALEAYSEDHGGLLPQATTKCPGGAFGTEWQGQMNIVWWDFVLPYVGSERVLYCPTAPPYLPSYAVNANVTFLAPGSLDDCTAPAATVLLAEEKVPHGPGDAVYIPAVSFYAPGLDDRFFRHSGKMNVCFADGHVKLTGAPDLIQGSPLWEVVKPTE
jgi:prepilin-type processing-associated H-X9-DG protein/prepilin-type N-terminal cleavage/methylation domain-containing protein